jgi:GTPase Era involved in 16S rRNA processing
VQEKVLKQGPQDNESAAEQAKDRIIAEQIREQYKKATGKDMPFAEAERKAQEEKKSGGFGGLFGGN